MSVSKLSQKFKSIINLCKKGTTIKDYCKKNKNRIAQRILASSDFNLDRINNYPKVLTKIAGQETLDNSLLYLTNKEVQGRYLVEDILGCGSQGCVYFAIDKKTKEPVILKSGQDIKNEIRILKLLKRESEYFPQYITDFTDSDGNKYIVTEPLLDGDYPAKDIFFYLKKEKDILSLSEKVSIYYKVLKAVKRLNMTGIKHKDIKPENILYSKEYDTIQIIDYGVACYKTDKECIYGFTRKYQPQGYSQKSNSTFTDISDLFSVIKLLGDIIDISQNKSLTRKLEGDSFDEKIGNLNFRTLNLTELTTLYSLLMQYCSSQDCMNFITIDDLIELFKNITH